MKKFEVTPINQYDIGHGQSFIKNLNRYKYVYIMAMPMIVYYILFHYMPMYGAIIAFKNYSYGKGILGSEWAGLQHFKSFFGGVYFVRTFKNTVLISLYTLIFEFPASIIFALLLNEISNIRFKKSIQTITYLPHFISIMVICGIIVDFTASDGVINDLLNILGIERQTMLLNPRMFKPVYVISEVWQKFGWGSIIYLAALTNIDNQLYEASKIDGANRWQQTVHISIPGILTTIVVLLILRVGQMMNVGFEKIILLYNPTTYKTADVISSYTYRKGILEGNYSYSTAVGLFNSVINFSLLLCTNYISRKLTDNSLW